MVKLPPRWMTTAPHARRVFVAGVPHLVPHDTTHHARTIGSMTTACGLGAHFWINFYDRPYLVGSMGGCPACDHVVAADEDVDVDG